ncbi:helix-turn-helix domain-containing protein [Streptomyces sp. NPDC001288]
MEATETVNAVEADRTGLIGTPSGRYLKVKDIASYLDVSLSTIYAAIEAGELAAVAIGLGRKKALRVHSDAFHAYEAKCRIPTGSPLAA